MRLLLQRPYYTPSRPLIYAPTGTVSRHSRPALAILLPSTPALGEDFAAACALGCAPSDGIVRVAAQRYEVAHVVAWAPCLHTGIHAPG
jgi:hypothetical protein